MEHREEIDGIVYMDNYSYGMFVGGVALAKAKEQPKFKVGDVVICTTAKEIDTVGVITELDPNFLFEASDDMCIQTAYENGRVFSINHSEVKRLATPEEITKWNKEVLEPNHLHYSTSKRKIIHWFLPFGKVIVKEEKETHWRADFFSNKEDEWYCCMSGNYEHCLPYNGKTAKLIGTTDDYEEKQE